MYVSLSHKCINKHLKNYKVQCGRIVVEKLEVL